MENEFIERMRLQVLHIYSLAIIWLVQSLSSQVTKLELARSLYSFPDNIDMVLETRLEQDKAARYMTIVFYDKNDFIVKKLEEPVLMINKVPYGKITEVRTTLSDIMLVLAEYNRSTGPKVEFNVSFNLYGGQFTLNQKGFIHPQTNRHRLKRAQRALINVENARLKLQASPQKQRTEIENDLKRAERDLALCKREMNEPFKDHEFLYNHKEALYFFQWALNAIDRVPELTKLLDESVVNKFQKINGATESGIINNPGNR
jgi:hypothetical protein